MVVSPNALDRFRGPNRVCSPKVDAAAGVALSMSALAHTVASTGRKLAVSSTREQFGNLVPVAVAKHDGQNIFVFPLYQCNACQNTFVFPLYQ
jgi:hypothetical protein